MKTAEWCMVCVCMCMHVRVSVCVHACVCECMHVHMCEQVCSPVLYMLEARGQCHCLPPSFPTFLYFLNMVSLKMEFSFLLSGQASEPTTSTCLQHPVLGLQTHSSAYIFYVESWVSRGEVQVQISCSHGKCLPIDPSPKLKYLFLLVSGHDRRADTI